MPVRNYYFATAEIVIDQITYQPLMKSTTQIRTSLTRAADLTTCELHNADTQIGQELMSLGGPLFSAQIKIGRYWKDLDAGAEYHKVLLSGALSEFHVSEDVVRISAVSDPYTQIPCGATRRVTAQCQWLYKDPATCGSTSTEPTCNLLLTHSGGCINRHSGTINRAKFGGFAYIGSENRFKVS
jgi:hypothetical protein